MSAKDGGICFNCKRPVKEEEFCHGCKAYICDKCDKTTGLFGSHSKERHLELILSDEADDTFDDDDPDAE